MSNEKTIAVILTVTLLISLSAIGVSATDKITDCGDDCKYYPMITCSRTLFTKPQSQP